MTIKHISLHIEMHIHCVFVDTRGGGVHAVIVDEVAHQASRWRRRRDRRRGDGAVLVDEVARRRTRLSPSPDAQMSSLDGVAKVSTSSNKGGGYRGQLAKTMDLCSSKY